MPLITLLRPSRRAILYCGEAKLWSLKTIEMGQEDLPRGDTQVREKGQDVEKKEGCKNSTPELRNMEAASL